MKENDINDSKVNLSFNPKNKNLKKCYRFFVI